jgi:hypothetical protein
MYNWREIFERRLVIVPRGYVAHPLYNSQETLQLHEICAHVMLRENIMLRYMSEAYAALVSWIVRHHGELMFCDVAGLDVLLENVVVL